MGRHRRSLRELARIQRSLLDVADRRFQRTWHTMKYRAENDGGGWARMWDDGAGDLIKRGHARFVSHRDALAAGPNG